jgi:hypothetical protein
VLAMHLDISHSTGPTLSEPEHEINEECEHNDQSESVYEDGHASIAAIPVLDFCDELLFAFEFDSIEVEMVDRVLIGWRVILRDSGSGLDFWIGSRNKLRDEPYGWV